MSDFLILRHAPTDWNIEKRLQGRADRPLSREGLALAGTWRPATFAVDWSCLSSPLRRAIDTAQAMGLQPRGVAGLIEMDWGTFEGRRLADLRREGGADFAAAEAQGLDFRPPGGESPRDVGARALTALAAEREPCVVVTHKGVLRALLALATGWDMLLRPPVRLADGCAHHFALTGSAWALRQANIPLARLGQDDDHPQGAAKETG